MRLISPEDQAKVTADPKAEVRTFYVEKAKGNTVPKHFFAEENKDQKTLKIDGQDVPVARNKERSEYCAFWTGQGDLRQAFYVRDHAFIDHSPEYVTYVKPKPEPKPKKEKVAKAEGDAAGAPEGTNFKTGKKGGKGKSAAAGSEEAPAADETASA